MSSVHMEIQKEAVKVASTESKCRCCKMHTLQVQGIKSHER